MGDGLIWPVACAVFYGQPFASSTRVTISDCLRLGGFDDIRIMEEYIVTDFTA